jgi:NADH-quinone oxidoreductase subunit J
MLFSTILFYQFSLFLIISALFVVLSRNTITSAMFLIFAFVNASALFLMIGAEFLAMLLIIVYVGAIAILFLFVVMMLDVDTRREYNIKKYVPILSLISSIFIIQIYIIADKSLEPTRFMEKGYYFLAHYKINPSISNTKALGDILYTDFFLQFQISGLILFVAMIGAIVLTLKEGDNFKKSQNISKQVFRKKEDSVEIVNVETNKGIDV